ncbi:MAG: hypothetical protein WC750_05430 [Patescibacteria group bacterium]|jgi:hypothetical protein
MSFRWYVILMGVGTALAWIAWLFVLQAMNPDEAGLTAFIFFYTTLFLSCVGTFSLLGLLYRIGVRHREAVLAREVRISFRHAILLSLVGTTALWLSAHRSLTWYWLITLILTVGVIEYLFILVQASRRQ